MNYNKTAKEILEYVGSARNVAGFTHCATRLRFTLNDLSKIDIPALKGCDGVIDVLKSGAQYQIIIGTDVVHVAKALNELGIGTSSEKRAQKTSIIDTFFDTVSGIFTPIIPAIIAAGMLKAILTLLSVTGLLADTSSSALVLGFIADAAFYFLPVFVAITTAQKLRCNPYLAGMIGAMFIHPTFLAMIADATPIDFFGVNLPLVSYASSVIPSILSVVFLSYVERFADQVTPKAVKFIFRPLITVILVAPFALLVFGPLGSMIGNLLASGANGLYNTAPWLVAMLMGAICPLLVLTGMHWSFVPVMVQSLETFGKEGLMGPAMFVSNLCQSSVSFAVGIKAKDTNLKQTAFSAGITALFGITEPALFGVSLKVKRAIYMVIIGGAVGGLYAGIMGTVGYALGAPGLASFALFVGENPMNIVHVLIAVAIGYAVTFVLTLLFVNPNEAMETQEPVKTFKVLDKKEITSPIMGELVGLKAVKDPMFANEIIGRGSAVIPHEGAVYAPFDGTVAMAFAKGHAIGLIDGDGLELLVHIGIDTVKLDGEGFKVLVKQGDSVKKGQKLVEFDIDKITAMGYDITTPILLTNLEADNELIINHEKSINVNDTLMVLL